ncbi:MAG TPA: extracellular solute-binding protein [Thermomicrobiales bacterium]|nr:extracellular solute-binding protein [Thermomicrobiales bacterium]
MSTESNFPKSAVSISRRELMAAGAAGGALAALGAIAPTSMAGAAQTEELSGEITYWHHFTSESEMQGLAQATEMFLEQYPGVSITSENIPNADYMTQFTTAAVAGALPSAAMASADRIPDMLALGGLVDLTDRFDSWEEKANISESLMPGATIDGQVVGLPMFLFVDWLYYRKDWFEEAGIEPPSTWEEMREAAIAITDVEAGRYGFGLRGGDGGQGGVMNVMRAFGGLAVDESGIPVIDREKAIEAVSFWAGLYTTDGVAPPSAPNDSYSQIMQAFRTGQTGMVLHHTGSLAEIMADLTPEQVMTIPVPAGPVMRVAGVSPQYNAITSDENQDAAWAWLTFWTTPDVAIDFLEITGYFPASLAASEDARITDNPIYDAARESIDQGVPPLQFVGAPGWAGTSVLPAFQQVLTGQATPEEAVDQMIADLEAEVG